MSIGRMIGRPGAERSRGERSRGGNARRRLRWAEYYRVRRCVGVVTKPHTTALQDANAPTANHDKKFPTLHSLNFVVVRWLGLVGC